LLISTTCSEKLATSKFMEHINKAIEDLDVASFSLHVVEISNFYSMLGSIGLAARDLCLKEIGRHLSALATGDALPARIDGDLFAVIRPNVGDEKDVFDFDVQLRTTLARPVRVLGHRTDPGARIASVMAPRDGHEADMLLNAALTLLHN
jgi:GGDEF domain-containing protein